MTPDSRRHRGAHPEDTRLFAEAQLPVLRSATADLSHLLSRDYALDSALKLVGDRYQLDARQRMAVRRSSCSDQSAAKRRTSHVPLDAVKTLPFAIDGYNLLTTIEAALGGAVILIGRDGCARDLARMGGTYRLVEETVPALELIARAFGAAEIGPATWFLDSPVSNSGRLAARLRAFASERSLPWTVELLPNPDETLVSSEAIVVTADSGILDRAPRWHNAAAGIVSGISDARIVDLGAL